MKRKVIAIIGVDDEIAFERIDDGPIPYFEREFKLRDKTDRRINHSS